MKNLFLIILTLLLATSSVMAQKPATTPDKEATTKATDATIKVDTPIDKIATGVPNIKFTETVHDFGKLKQNNPATCVFEFTNTGTDAVSLTDVKAGCGCTIPTWDKNPVEAGKTGKITAVYNSVNPGNFTKSITVTFSNGTVEYLTIKGNVEPDPSVPNTPAIPVTPLVTPNN